MLGGGILYDLRGELALIGNRKSCENDLANSAEQQLSHWGRQWVHLGLVTNIDKYIKLRY